MPYENLSKGSHTITVEASDVYGNTGTGTIGFLVVEGPLTIEKLMGYPNPFSDHTRISFQHNRAGDDLEIVAEVLNSSGQLVKRLQTVRKHAESTVQAFEWNSGGHEGILLESGLYIVRLSMWSLKDGSTSAATLKLVMIN